MIGNFRHIKTLLVLIFMLLFCSSSFAISKRHNDVVYNRDSLALMALECINSHGDMEIDRQKIIKDALNHTKKLSKRDSSYFYLYNLLDLSFSQYVKGDLKYVNKRSKKLMPVYSANDTVLDHVMHWDTPTWNGFYKWTLNQINPGKEKSIDMILYSSLALGDERKIIISEIFQEIPFDLEINSLNKYLKNYVERGATCQDILYICFRALDESSDDFFDKCLLQYETKEDNLNRKQIVRWGLQLYRMFCHHNIPLKTEYYNLSKNPQKLRGFIINLFGILGVSYKSEISPLVGLEFGEDSEPYNCIIGKKPSILNAADSLTWRDKVIASQKANDTETLSSNIVNGLYELSQTYDYASVLSWHKEWHEFIQPYHDVEYLYALGQCYFNLSLFSEAEKCYRAALSVYDSGVLQKGVNLLSPTKESILTGLGYALSNMGNYDEAIKTIDYDDSMLLDYAKIIHFGDLGRMWAYLDLAESNKYFEKANALIGGKWTLLNTTNEVWHYISWAQVTSDFKLKRNLIAKAENILHNSFSKPSDVVTGILYLSLGKYYYSILDYKIASGYFDKAEQYMSLLRPEDRRKSELIRWKSLNEIALKKTEYTKQTLVQHLALQDSILGSSHYDCHKTVKVLLELAVLEQDSNLAEEYFERYNLYKDSFPRERDNFTNNIIEASVLALMGNSREAYDMLDYINMSTCEASVGLRALEIKLQLTHSLPTRIRTEELIKINEAAQSLSARLFTEISGEDRIAWSHRLATLRSGFVKMATNQSLNDNLLDFSLFSKGLLFRTNRHVWEIVKKSRDGKFAMNELSAMSDSISHYMVLSDSLKIADFKRQYAEKERSIIERFITPDKMLRGIKIGKTDVLNGIGNTGLAIEFIRYNNNDSVRYAALAFSKNIPTKLIDLFAEEELLSLIVDDSGRRCYDNFNGKYSDARLYSLVWGKLVQLFSGYTDVYFCSDGELNQIAIEHLTDIKGKPVGGNVRIHRTFHLGEISSDATAKSNIVCLGVANHDNPVQRNGDDVDRGLWCNLQCDKEISDIKGYYKHRKGIFSIDDVVTEPYVNGLNYGNTSILHLSTHGFYYNNDKLRSYSMRPNCPDYYLANRALSSGKNSMSGLVLRKGNEYRKQPHLESGYDDIWDSDEIESMQFPNLKLTVLSACQTGLGESDSEGVWGLPRAFRIAGTQKLICALDYVNDKRTREFMGVLYKNISRGISIYDSFQIARTRLYKKHTDDPRMWSAFILIE